MSNNQPIYHKKATIEPYMASAFKSLSPKSTWSDIAVCFRSDICHLHGG